MTDKNDDDKGSRPRSAGRGGAGAGGDGEKRRVFKPRPLGDGPRPARGEKPAGSGPRKSFGRPVESTGSRDGRPPKPRPLVADGVPRSSARGDAPRSFDSPARGDGPRSFGKRDEARSSGGTDAPRKPRTPVVPDEAAGTMRIAKRLARAGIASRRDAEGMIADGQQWDTSKAGTRAGASCYP